MAKTRKKVAIGIDLGTTKCCVGVVRDGKVEILENERANKTTPSYVAFTATDRLVGEEAKDQATLNIANTIFGVKRMMGRDFHQATTFCLENYMSFDVVEDERSPRFRVNYKGEELQLSPEQVSSMLLSKMKNLAEQYVGAPVTDAVISVPAYFNDAQRRATRVAANIAGLNVLKLIKEPTAAAITFASNRRSKEKETIVMVDIGGGVFDAVLLVVDRSSVEVKTIKGDCHFGGQNLDTLLLNHFADQFQEKYGKDLRTVKRATERLRVACIKVKHTLTLLPMASHVVECLDGDIDFNLEITRETFENLLAQSVTDTMKPVLDILLINHPKVDHVAVVGGSIRVPKLQDFLREYFQKDLMKTVNADEAVAYGATYHAAMLSGDYSLPEIRVSDLVAPHSIDAVLTHNPSVILVQKLTKAFGNANKRSVPLDPCITFNETVHYWDHSKTEYNRLGVTYPDVESSETKEAKKLEVHKVSDESKEAKKLEVDQGSDELKKAKKLEIHNGFNESKKVKNFEIDYGFDSDGLFFAPASKKRIEADSKSFWKRLYVKNRRQSELQHMKTQYDRFEEDHKNRQAQIHAYSELESLCFELKQRLSDHRGLGVNERKEAEERCDETLDWLECYSVAELEEIERKHSELEAFVLALLNQ